MSFLNEFLVKHNDEGTLVILLAKLTASLKEHRYLIDLEHAIGEEEFFAVHGCSLFLWWLILAALDVGVVVVDDVVWLHPHTSLL